VLDESRVESCVGVVTNGDCLGLTVISSMILTVLLMIGGIEQNPVPFVKLEITVGLTYWLWQEYEFGNPK
jgi:hypothetical protein